MITVLALGGASVSLADNEFGDNLGDGVAGPMGLLIIVLLAIATVLLVRNMNSRLKRLPDHFPTERELAERQAALDAEASGNLPNVDALTLPDTDGTKPRYGHVIDDAAKRD